MIRKKFLFCLSLLACQAMANQYINLGEQGPYPLLVDGQGQTNVIFLNFSPYFHYNCVVATMEGRGVISFVTERQPGDFTVKHDNVSSTFSIEANSDIAQSQQISLTIRNADDQALKARIDCRIYDQNKRLIPNINLLQAKEAADASAEQADRQRQALEALKSENQEKLVQMQLEQERQAEIHRAAIAQKDQEAQMAIGALKTELGQVSEQERTLQTQFDLERYTHLSATALIRELQGMGIPADFLPDNFIKDEEHEMKRKWLLLQIVKVMWAINQKAFEEGRDVKRGSFTVIDPKGELYELLLNYVKFATHGQYQALNPLAYSRSPLLNPPRSSHYKDEDRQFGIDMRWHHTDWVSQSLLPHHMTHLLFGRVNKSGNEVTFVKFEPDSIGTYTEQARHGMAFFQALFFNPEGKEGVHREKDVPKAIQKAYLEHMATMEKPAKAKTVEAMFHHVNECWTEGALKDEDLDGLTSSWISIKSPAMHPEAVATRNAFFNALDEEKFTGPASVQTGNEAIVDIREIPVLNDVIKTLNGIFD